MKLYREYRDGVIRTGKPILSSSHIKSQFMSVFKYPESTHLFIKHQGHMKDLKGKEVYCDELLLDVDNPEQLEPVIDVLRNLGWNYTQYTTGNRGAHFHVCIKPIMGEHVPYSIKQFLRRVELFERVDTSFYHPAGQFRQEGATHQKTGKIKTLVTSRQGLVPTIPIVAEPEPEIDEEVSEDTHTKFMYGVLLLSDVGKGKRYHRLYAIVRHGLKLGYDPSSIRYDVGLWNDNLLYPHSDTDINKWFDMILRQEARRYG